MGFIKSSLRSASALALTFAMSSCNYDKIVAASTDFDSAALNLFPVNLQADIVSGKSIAPAEFIEEFKQFLEAAQHVEKNYVTDINWPYVVNELMEYHDQRFGLSVGFKKTIEDQIKQHGSDGPGYLALYAPLIVDISYKAYAAQHPDPVTGQFRFDALAYATKATEIMFDSLDKYSYMKFSSVASNDNQDETSYSLVDYTIDADIGYLKLDRFGKGADDDLKDRLSRLYENGITSFVLDLRGNPGGYVYIAENIADLFLDEGLILKQIGKNKNKTKHADHGDITNGSPLVILVDERSASSSEILSLALKENDRAIIIGQTTKGKGTSYVNYELDNGDKIQLTNSFLFGPDSISIQNIGIAPDIWVVENGIRFYSVSHDRKHSILPNPNEWTQYPDPPDQECSTMQTEPGSDKNIEDVSVDRRGEDLALQCAVDYLKGYPTKTLLTQLRQASEPIERKTERFQVSMAQP